MSDLLLTIATQLGIAGLSIYLFYQYVKLVSEKTMNGMSKKMDRMLEKEEKILDKLDMLIEKIDMVCKLDDEDESDTLL